MLRAPVFFRQAGERPSGVELFFDLVFVFCIAQLARLLRQDPTWDTAGVVVALFVPVWWTWVGVTFCTDRFPTDDVLERALLISAAGAVGVMGVALTNMPASGSAAFAVGYAVVRLILVVLYARAGRANTEMAAKVQWYWRGFAITAALWLASVAVPPPERWLVWAVALLVDVGIPVASDRRRGLLPVDVHHLPDRFAAFVIIVLGESLITTATLAVDGRPLTGRRITLLAASFLLAAALWWGYFDRGAWQRRYRQLAGDNSGRLANIVCAYLHFPLVAGITLAAAGMELSAGRAGRAIGSPAAVSLTAGIALYLAALSTMTAVLHVPRGESLSRWRAALIAALGVLAVAGRGLNSTVFVAVSLSLALIHVAVNIARDRRISTPIRDE